MADDLIERNTHLLDWLSDAHTHCQHGTKGWCEAYLHNARDVIKSQDDALTSKDAALSEMRAELERWQANWDANVQEMSEKFRAVNLAQVMAGTNLDLLARAEAAESQLEMARKALEPFAKYMESGKFDIDNKGAPLPDEQGVGWVYLTIGDFRAAARALADGETK